MNPALGTPAHVTTFRDATGSKASVGLPEFLSIEGAGHAELREQLADSLAQIVCPRSQTAKHVIGRAPTGSLNLTHHFHSLSQVLIFAEEFSTLTFKMPAKCLISLIFSRGLR